jgi:hypothetical protein
MTSQPELRFRHLRTGEEVGSIWSELRSGKLWRSAYFERHEANTLAGAGDRTGWSAVVSDWLALHSGQSWCEKMQAALDSVHIPTEGPGGMDDFLEAALRFFSRYEGQKIGVQLSGGLDSSLVIGLLRHFGIKHGLVGLRSARYEFRTERHVQEVLAKECGDVELIDEAGCLPCAGLNHVPPHQVPDLLCLNYAQDADMAEACLKLGVEVLLSGGGGDNLLGQAVPSDSRLCPWRPQTFTDQFPVDVAYRPRGVEFLSFFGDHGVVDSLYRLRRGQGEDYRKLWARAFFQDFLPRELVNFHYCADFWGRDIDGLVKALPAVWNLHRAAREYTGDSYFDDKRLKELIAEDILRPRKELYQRIEARLSSATWVCSLERWLKLSPGSMSEASGTFPAKQSSQCPP